MNMTQARRIALATEASYILFGASTDAITDLLCDADAERFRKAQTELANQMLRRAGFNAPMNADQIVEVVLHGDRPAAQGAVGRGVTTPAPAPNSR